MESVARRKFNKEQAEKMWSNYTANLVESLNETEVEGLEKGYSSYEIEKLWQEKTRKRYSKDENSSSQ